MPGIRPKLLIVLIAGLIFVVLADSSIAGPERQQSPHYGQGGDWSVSLGAAGMYKPEYEGSGDYEFQGFPNLDIKWRDTFFLNVRNGLGTYFWRRDDMKLGVSLGYAFGRDEDDSSALNGLGDIDDGATGKILFEWKIEKFSLTSQFEQQLTGEDTGFQVHLDLGYVWRLGNKAILKPSLAAIYASSDYMEKYFGISPSQSSRSGLAVYDPDSGCKSVGFHLMSIYSLNRHWGVQAMANYDRLVDDTGNSPFVKDENQFFLFMGISYLF